MSWTMLGLEVNGKGLPFTNLDNATRVIAKHPDMQGRFWYDEFHQKVMAKGPPVHELGDDDVLDVTKWMQQAIGLRAMADDLVRKAIAYAASKDKRCEPLQWLESLQWDYTPRLYRWFAEYLGTKDTPYTRAVGRNFLRSAVARILKPGCQVDTMPILEGHQGIYKSQAIRILGRPWTAVTHEQVTSKDFFVVLQGILIMEIDEFESFGKADTARIKGVLSTQMDRYRTPYGRLAQNHPRRAVLVATTNEETYLKDVTGARRFWPVRCGKIDLVALERDRDQLWAEAAAEVKAGEEWWHMPDETKGEQEQRRSRDAWEDIIHRYLEEHRVQASPDSEWIWAPRHTPLTECTMSDALQCALDIQPGRWNRADQMRVADCFRAMGWVRTLRQGRWIYVRPRHEESR
jgi:predicted P-loop ATPase